MRFQKYGKQILIGLLGAMLIACGGAAPDPGGSAPPAAPSRGTSPAVADSPEPVQRAEPTAPADENSFQLTVGTRSGGAVLTVFFHNGKAFAKEIVEPEIYAIFDLTEKFWFDIGSGKRMTEKEADGLLREGYVRVLAGLAEQPDGFRKRMGVFLVEPEFEVEERADRIEFTSEFSVFTVETIQPEVGRWATEFHAYSKMASGWGFVIGRVAPDEPLNMVMARLEQKGLLPTRVANVPTPATGLAGNEITLGYEPLDAEVGAALDGLYAALVGRR